MIICVVVLPSSGFLFWIFVCCEFYSLHVGEIHRVDFYLDTRSPLSEPVYSLLFFFVVGFQMTGRYTGERRFLTLVLPSMNRKYVLVCFFLLIYSRRGDSQGVVFLSILVLPFVIFRGVNLMGSQGLDSIHRGRLWLGHAIPYIVYI